MLLAIDSGNTNVVVGVYDGEVKKCQWRAATWAQRTADEYAAFLTQWLAAEGLAPADVTDVVIATVVPRTLRDLRQLAEKTFGCSPLIVGDPGVSLGIEVRLERPAEVGADRLVNAIAAHVTYGEALIVLDFGTATTFDVVDGDGNYCGGVIAPGVNLSLEALHGATAQLPRIAVDAPPRVIGGGTVGAMQSGIYWGYIGLIEGLVARIRGEWGGDLKVVATGGLASLFAGGTPMIGEVDPDLTLRGLLKVHRHNRP